MVADPKHTVTSDGLAAPEGPYTQWDLPVIRWAKSPVVRLEIPATKDLGLLEVSFALRLQARERGTVDVVFNGQVVKTYSLAERTAWQTETVTLAPQPGRNVLEFRNVALGKDPDWLDYVERYSDIKNYLVSQHYPLEKGAREHYELFGVKEHRVLNLHRTVEKLEPPQPQLYFLFSSLQVTGYRKP